uniref:Mab-21 domain-containing protein n=1 Tax=Heterorhabditis bacteriophora TaxID=37862 RepID=A0A1I7X6B4_HETBA
MNCRLAKNIRWSLLVDLARILTLHGIPFLYAKSTRSSLKRTEFNYKYFPTKNIEKLKARSRSRSNAPYTLRYQLCMASRHRNYRSILGNLANSPLIRNITEIIDDSKDGWRKLKYCHQRHIFFDSPIMMNMALHAVLNMSHVRANLILNFHISYLFGSLSFRNIEQVGIDVIHSKSCHIRTHYTMLVPEFNNWRQCNHLFTRHMSLGIHATVFIETACRIWVKLGRCEDKISNLLSSFVQCYPQLANRVVKFLEEINMPHEIDLVIYDACTPDSNPSPSDIIWLEWCEPRVQSSERFGIRDEILRRCAEVLFKFLDYGCNRKSSRAWILLHAVVQLIEKSSCELMWRDRAEWWPRFHTVLLEPLAHQCRKEIIEALMELPVI